MIQLTKEKILQSYPLKIVDILVEDKDNQPILIVEVKGGKVSQTNKQGGKQQLMGASHFFD